MGEKGSYASTCTSSLRRKVVLTSSSTITKQEEGNSVTAITKVRAYKSEKRKKERKKQKHIQTQTEKESSPEMNILRSIMNILGWSEFMYSRTTTSVAKTWAGEAHLSSYKSCQLSPIITFSTEFCSTLPAQVTAGRQFLPQTQSTLLMKYGMSVMLSQLTSYWKKWRRWIRMI